MECREVQEELMESLDGALSRLEKSQLEAHLSKCPECSQFAAMQHQIDLRLCQGITVPKLSQGFRAAVKARIEREKRETWPDWLPDIAHFAGSGLAIAICALILPLPAPLVLEAGAFVALLTYVLQTILVSTLEEKTE